MFYFKLIVPVSSTHSVNFYFKSADGRINKDRVIREMERDYRPIADLARHVIRECTNFKPTTPNDPPVKDAGWVFYGDKGFCISWEKLHLYGA